MIVSRIAPIAVLVILIGAGCQPGLEENIYPSEDAIRLNQVGFQPSQPKQVVIVGSAGDEFSVVSTSTNETVFTGEFGPEATWDFSGETVRLADFSSVAVPGTYHIEIPGLGHSYPFEIGDRVLDPVVATTLKALYYQRASTDLPEQFAGKWTRASGHADNAVLIHASAASEARPEGTSFSSPGGWYDAGDYNKYIVPAAFTSYHLLAAYEKAPSYFTTLALNIPESGNSIPDVLDEALWNLRWMQTMQDPNDGGVYHKLTHAGFSGMVMPEAATSPRYVVQKSTAAALTFAAAMAQADRTFRGFESLLPGFADSCGAAAAAAWRWAEENPDVLYNQGQLNERFDPDLSTGAYGDRELSDERYWAASELYLSTGRDDFLADAPAPENIQTPYWEWSVAMLGTLSLSEAGIDSEESLVARSTVLAEADRLLALRESSPYGVAVNEAADFMWGGNGYIASKAGVLLSAYEASGQSTYLDAAYGVVDYLLGRNATGYSFVTGLGDKPPMFIHHRPSEADGIADPVPGLLAGGPTSVITTDCPEYPSGKPARRYLDEECSYSSNEITTYWNTPLTYAAALLQRINDEQN